MSTGVDRTRMTRQLNGEMGARLGLSFWRTDLYYRCARERFLHFA